MNLSHWTTKLYHNYVNRQLSIVRLVSLLQFIINSLPDEIVADGVVSWMSYAGYFQSCFALECRIRLITEPIVNASKLYTGFYHGVRSFSFSQQNRNAFGAPVRGPIVLPNPMGLFRCRVPVQRVTVGGRKCRERQASHLASVLWNPDR